MPASADAASAREHLAALAADLEAATAAGPVSQPGHDRVAELAGTFLSELTERTYSTLDVLEALRRITTASQASIAAARDGDPDPLRHLREVLEPLGLLPGPEDTPQTLLADPEEELSHV